MAIEPGAAPTLTPAVGFEVFPYPGRKSPWGFLLFGIFLIIAGAFAAISNIREGDWIAGIGVAWLATTLGAGAIGLPLMNRPSRAPFRYLNSVVLTRQEHAPIDSWVHVAPTRPLNLGLQIFTLFAAIGISTIAIAGFLQLFGVMPKLNEETSIGGILMATIVSTLVGAVACWLAYLNLARAWRNGRFGARPSGVTLGQHTVTVRVPGRSGELKWEEILSVESRETGGKNSTGLIALHLAPSAGVTGNVQLLVAHGHTVPAHALWTAIRWYHAHPEARWELGRIEGERRIEGWRLTAAQMR